jgi:hypothetical protein
VYIEKLKNNVMNKLKQIFIVIGSIVDGEGIAWHTEGVEILAENGNAFVLNNSEYTSVYKQKGDSGKFGRKYINRPFVNQFSNVANGVEYKGFFEEKQMGKEIVKRVIEEEVEKKFNFYKSLKDSLK